MFITINNNQDCLYNAMLIAHFKKDIENLELHYFLQNGTKLSEKFDNEDSLNTKFDLVSNIKFGGASEEDLQGFIASTSVSNVVTISQADYEKLETKDDTTLYVVVG